MAHRSRASKQSESGLREPKLKILWFFFEKVEKSQFIWNFLFEIFFWWIMMKFDGFDGFEVPEVRKNLKFDEKIKI